MLNSLKRITFSAQKNRSFKYLPKSENKKLLLSSISMMSSKRELCSTERQLKQSIESLPKLPVPALNQTMERLLSSAKPFARSSDELKELQLIIEQFSSQNGIGSKLQSLLELKGSQTSNWLSHDWWVNKAYLEGRDPIMIWSNPGLVFPHLPKPNKSSKSFVAEFISRLIIGVIDFRNQLRNGVNPELPKDSAKGGPVVCMDQYKKVFGTCRTPGIPFDSIRFGKLENNNISIIISRFNKFYKLSLAQSENINEIFSIIKSSILNILSETSSEIIPIGSFSALNRNDFATVYQLLDQNELKAINESEFIVSIDHIEDSISFEKSQTYNNFIGKQLLHADVNNIGNRWFDKTIQLIIVSNKECDQIVGAGFCYEHTPAEGPPIVKLMEHTVKHLSTFTPSLPKTSVKSDLRKLQLVPDINRDKIMASAEFSIDNYWRFIDSLDLDVLEFKQYGKEFIKSVKYSPDSWIQLAINLAFYRLHGRIGACYESASTRKFAFGRTDTIRSVTNEFKHFFESPNFQTLNKAIESHKNVVKNAMNGNGIDRLLLGYNCVAQEIKSGKWKWGLTEEVINNPLNERDYYILEKLYKNDLYLRSKHYSLSTSQVATIFPNSFMCYGPLVYDGYGCCYNPSKNQITFAISAFKVNNNDTNASNYKIELENSLNLMNDIVSKHSKL